MFSTLKPIRLRCHNPTLLSQWDGSRGWKEVDVVMFEQMVIFAKNGGG